MVLERADNSGCSRRNDMVFGGYVSSKDALKTITGIADLDQAKICVSREQLFFEDPQLKIAGFLLRRGDIILAFKQSDRSYKKDKAWSCLSCYDESTGAPEEVFSLYKSGKSEVTSQQIARMSAISEALSGTGTITCNIGEIVRDAGNVTCNSSMLDISIGDKHHFFPRDPGHLAVSDTEAYLDDIPGVVEYVRSNGYAPAQSLMLESMLEHLARVYRSLLGLEKPSEPSIDVLQEYDDPL